MPIDEYVESFKLGEREYGDTHSRMWKLGYRGMGEFDARVFKFLGEEIYKKIIFVNFRATLIERNYLQKTTRQKISGKEFNRMCSMNKYRIMKSVCQCLPYLYDQEIQLEDISDREILMGVMKKYYSPENNYTVVRFSVEKRSIKVE